MPPLQRLPVDKNWQFRQTTNLPASSPIATSYLPVSQFPTVAHLDLLYHNLIPDPYIDTNELATLWVNDADFTYRTSLPPLPPLLSLNSQNIEMKKERRVNLVFEGLDTVCDVYLNDKLILESRNMHISHRVDIASFFPAHSHLQPQSQEKEIILELRFSNAPEFAKIEQQRIGYKGNGTDVHFGGPERLLIRKSQYHWGWDWGPAVNCCGPWKGIFLEVFEERIEEFLVRQEVAEDLGSVGIKIKGLVGGGGGRRVEVEVRAPDGESVVRKEVEVDTNGQFNASLRLENPELWWPFTYGGQPLYTVSATLPGFHQQTLKIGFRRLRLLQHSLKKEPGTSFTFEINNTRIFCGGQLLDTWGLLTT